MHSDRPIRQAAAVVAVAAVVTVLAVASAPVTAQQVIATIPLPIAAGAVKTVSSGFAPAFDPTRNRLYDVASSYDASDNELASFVAVIDGASESVLTTIALPAPNTGNAVYNPLNDTVYVGTFQAGIQIISAATNSITGTITSTITGGTTEAGILALDPVNNLLYASDFRDPFIRVVDCATNSFVNRISLDPLFGNFPGALAVDTERDRIYMTYRSGASRPLVVIDGATQSILATNSSHAFGTMALDLVNDQLYLADPNAHTFSVVDLDLGAVIASGLPLAPGGSEAIGGLAYDPIEDRLVATRVGSGTLDLLDPAGFGVVSTTQVCATPCFGVAVDAVRHELYVVQRDTFIGHQTPGALHVVGFTQSVTIDIKPDSSPNVINLGSNGNVPVAILSSGTFDATTVDPLTVTLASAPVRLKGRGTPMASPQDVDNDGLIDLLVHVDTTALQLSAGDTVAVLDGKTYGGLRIRGSDAIQIVP